MRISLFFSILLISLATAAQSQTLTYGESISLQNAKKVADAARTFALQSNWTVVIAIVDTGSNLVLLEKIDNTQLGSVEVAIQKAKTANNFKRPSREFQERLADGGVANRTLVLPGALPIEGGEPIIVGGKIVGAIGVSGMQSTQDSEVVRAGLAALK